MSPIGVLNLIYRLVSDTAGTKRSNDQWQGYTYPHSLSNIIDSHANEIPYHLCAPAKSKSDRNHLENT